MYNIKPFSLKVYCHSQLSSFSGSAKHSEIAAQMFTSILNANFHMHTLPGFWNTFSNIESTVEIINSH